MIDELPSGYGQVAYEGYRAKSGGVSLVSGQPIPEWGSVPQKIQDAWDAGAQALIDYLDRIPR